MTAPPTLYWNMLRWNFDVERVAVILGHNVQYTATRSTSKFHLNMFQYSVGGAVMLDAITYGQDCI